MGSNMRDTSEGMPEIVDALEQDSKFVGIVRVKFGDTSKQFQFGISLDGYRALKKMLQLRPFDAMPGVGQKYYLARSYSQIPGSSDCIAVVRVVQSKDGRQPEVRVPRDLLSNLLWFAELRNPAEAAHLIEIK
jgi:hypothetical protein